MNPHDLALTSLAVKAGPDVLARAEHQLRRQSVYFACRQRPCRATWLLSCEYGRAADILHREMRLYREARLARGVAG